jgi:carboxymethylenebutenolidase
MVNRIAADGYVVLAPNVFYRAGRSPVLPLPDLTDADERTRFFQSLRPHARRIEETRRVPL